MVGAQRGAQAAHQDREDVDGARQYGAPFGVTSLSQNGYAPGQITGVTIESDGIIMARYSNGQNKPAGLLQVRSTRPAVVSRRATRSSVAASAHGPASATDWSQRVVPGMA